MAKIDQTLKRIFAWAVLLCVIASMVSLYIYFDIQQRQSERELIYIKARALAAEQQRQRTQQWEKRRREQELQREYRRGRVVDMSRPSAPSDQPAKSAAQPAASQTAAQ